MSLETQLAEASTRERYIAVLKITLTELATALWRLAQDEGFPITVDWRQQHAGMDKRAGSSASELSHFGYVD